MADTLLPTITYLTGADHALGREIAADGLRLGCLVQPSCRFSTQPYAGAGWAADNGCFSSKGFTEARWWDWLAATTSDGCHFATAPDVVGDHAATVERSLPWLPKIRALGHRAAFVGQNGASLDTVPWDAFDVLFLGGSPECLACGWVRPATAFKVHHCPSCARKLTEWKLGQIARDLTAEATRRGIPVHMGRVNSLKRLVYAQEIGCSTADGTWLAFGADANAPRLRRALEATVRAAAALVRAPALALAS